MGKNYDYTYIFDGVYPLTEYNPLPMTEQLFWNRVGQNKPCLDQITLSFVCYGLTSYKN